MVSKKFSNKASIRNKTKRRLRDLSRASLPNLKGKYDMVILVKSGIEKEEYKNLKIIFNHLLEKAGLLK